MNSTIKFLIGLYQGRRTIRALAMRDVLARYSGTLFRGAWELVNPAITLLVFWFVFSVAFKAKGPAGIPFILYFVTGYVPWLFFSESLMRGTQGVVAHSFLVKKMVFPSELLPFVYLTGGAINHALLLLLSIVVLLFNGISVSWYWLQIGYYFVTLCAILVGLQWLLSAVNVFNRDLGQGVGVVLNVWFWMTPVVWVADGVIPAEYQWLMFANPLYYIIDGYRGALLYQQPFWIHWQQGLYVWSFALVFAVLGASVFRRLKPHFGDVL
ncbi:MAG: ABC transporter permease [Methylococcaceae bacterium]|jgi:lipopolysaccharide transport system permease protein/teichoic acid transport system permease protein